MAFAIKLERYKLGILNDQEILLESKFFSQEIQTLTPTGFNSMILLADKESVDEIDISGTLIEAELKAERINKFISKKRSHKHGFLKTRIVEFDGLLRND